MGFLLLFQCKILVLLLTLAPLALTDVVSYDWTIQRLPVNADGFPRSGIAVYPTGSQNWGDSFRPFPGPAIRAFVGDTVNVTVHNAMETEFTSIHFHGVHMKDNVWMDGVPMITECGIAPGGTFSYVWKVTQTGSYWYHSHAGVQYSDGLLGPIILESRTPTKKSIERTYKYEFDYFMILQDWFHASGNEWIVSANGPTGAIPSFTATYPWPPSSLLINGRGQYNCTANDFGSGMLFGPCGSPPAPNAFKCAANGGSIRMRVVNSASDLPIRFWIDNHNMTIVARDGVDIKPVDVEYLSLPLAMRLDVIINCTNDPSMHYTIYAAPASGFLQSNAKPPNVLARAFLVYGDSTIIAPPSNPSLLINTLRPDNVMNEYSMLVPKQSPKTAAADKRIVILYNSAGRGAMGSGAGTWVVNGKSFMMPTKAPVLQAAVLSGDIDSAGLKMHSNGPVPVETYMEHLEYGKRYEVVVVGRNFQQHPWHIHGYTVDMVAAGYLNLTAIPSYVDTNTNRTVTDWSKFNIETNVALPNWNQEVTVLSRGDSFSVPPMGYTVFRFTADNIGPWMFHCHVEWHMAFGMAMMFSVESHPGEAFPYKSLAAPPKDFLTCGIPAAWSNAEAGVSRSDELLGNAWFWVSLGTLVALTIALSVIGYLLVSRSKKDVKYKKLAVM